MGVMLYWAEGSKQKVHLVSQGVAFSNSDPMMVKIFLRWLREILGVNDDDIKFELYIHEDAEGRVKEAIKHWAEVVGIARDHLGHVYFKKHRPTLTNRKNVGKSYYGLIRVGVRKSTNLNRKINGWIEGICQNCGVV